MNLDTHILVPDDNELPEFLYRILPLERFLTNCQTSQNSLVSPANWSDVYEAAQLRTQIESPLFVDGNSIASSGLRDDIPRKVGGTMRHSTAAAKNAYCQCWSDLPESDAMWRLYSFPDAMGVKIKVKAYDLLSSLFDATGYENVYLGKVEYISQSEYDTLILDAKKNHLIQRRPNLFDVLPGESWARCLLRKREQYKHESEYRLMMTRIHPDGNNDAPTLWPYAFDHNTLVRQVELDSRCGNVDEETARIRKVGFQGEVKRSGLYDAPKLTVRPSWPDDEGWLKGSERTWSTPK